MDKTLFVRRLRRAEKEPGEEGTSAVTAQDWYIVALQDKEEAMADTDELKAAVAQWVEAFHTCHFERSHP